MAFNPTLRAIEKHNEINSEDRRDQIIDGVKTIRGVPVARIAEQREKVIIRPDDVFVVTYPKCGTTWMQQIVKLIANNGVENGIDHDAAIPWIEQMYLEEIESMSSRRFFKSHLPYKLMAGGGDPEKSKGKYIYVLRNPKDMLVSNFHFFQKFPGAPDWKTFFKAMTSEDDSLISYGTFHSHYLGWWAHKDAPNILILTYEQMKRNLRSAVTVLTRC